MSFISDAICKCDFIYIISYDSQIQILKIQIFMGIYDKDYVKDLGFSSLHSA